eukprot:Gb_37886 [translate_table: standard]
MPCIIVSGIQVACHAFWESVTESFSQVPTLVYIIVSRLDLWLVDLNIHKEDEIFPLFCQRIHKLLFEIPKARENCCWPFWGNNTLYQYI